ncbi:uncharacterized protein BDV17DRAFT_100925 [Aspergillus undulatus]|uniref:uncharacterized protein n=1 Tax=Aspergillus undulatus TaxID=1810928 RepID=UPI003CCCD741
MVDESHDHIKQCCFMRMENSLTGPRIKGIHHLPPATSAIASHIRDLVLEVQPFLEYAVNNVWHDANTAEEGGVGQSNLLQDLRRCGWVKLYNTFQRKGSLRHREDVNFLTIADRFNLTSLLAAHKEKWAVSGAESHTDVTS